MIRRIEHDFAYVSVGEAQLMLEQYSPKGWSIAELIMPLRRGVNFQIELEDIKSLLACVSANGYKLHLELRDNHYTIGETTDCQKEFLIYDSDGFLLRFTQHME